MFVLFIFLCNIREPYKIKIELIGNVIYFVVLLIIYVSLIVISFLTTFIEYNIVPQITILAIYFEGLTFINVWLPIIQTFDFFYFCRKKKIFDSDLEMIKDLDKILYLKYMIFPTRYLNLENKDTYNFETTKHFYSILENKDSYGYFMDFCKSEWSTENMVCFLSIKKIKNGKNTKKMKMIDELIKVHIQPNSVMELNLPSKLKKNLLKNYTDGVDMNEGINSLESELIFIMQDSYSRFLISKYFSKMQKDLQKIYFVQEIGIE
jgi:hypothetical protein